MSQLSKVLRSAEDNGLIFCCPGCNQPHQIHYGEGAGLRWEWDGNADKPTFRPSILVQYDKLEPPNIGGQQKTPENQALVKYVCHSFISDGRIMFLDDCTHILAGQVVELPGWGNNGPK